MSVSSQYTPVWNTVKNMCVESVAAGAAIVPLFYLFEVKTSQQTAAPIPMFLPSQALRNGLHAAPITGAMIGAQRVAQLGFEKAMQSSPQEKESFLSAMVSAAFVGCVSTHPMAIFQGLTRGKTVDESLKALTWKHAVACAYMEVGFLFGMGSIRPMEEFFREKFGKKKSIEYAATFTSGAVGAAFGHAGDAAFTMLQNNVKIERVTQLARGGPVRAVAVGAFTCFYKAIKELCS
jgi:hypothetical protein